VVSSLQIGKADALQVIGHGGQAVRALRLSARQRRMVRDLIEIELTMRGLHLPKGWMNQPRRNSPFLGRTPLELMIAEDVEGSGQLIEFLARLRFNGEDTLMRALAAPDHVVAAAQVRLVP
jgi:hypothetical protein